MNTSKLKVYYFPSKFSHKEGILILSANKKEAIVKAKALSGWSDNCLTSKSEVIEDYDIWTIDVVFKNDFYYISNVIFTIGVDNQDKYHTVESLYYSQEQEKTEKELIKLFLENLKTKEFKYDF